MGCERRDGDDEQGRERLHDERGAHFRAWRWAKTDTGGDKMPQRAHCIQPTHSACQYFGYGDPLGFNAKPNSISPVYLRADVSAGRL